MRKHRFLERPRMKPLIMLATILVFFLFIFILNGSLWSGTRMNTPTGTVDYLEKNWSLQGPNGVMEEKVGPGDRITLHAGTPYTMTTFLTYDGSQDETPYCFLHVEHMFCRVSLNGEILFQYLEEDSRKPDLSRSPGFIYKAFPLPKDCRGMKLQVELFPVLPTITDYELPEVSFGDYRSVVRTQAEGDIPHNVVMILCMMMGISALVFSAASLTGSDYREGFNIGAFALLVSVYFLTDCRTNFYYIANPYYLYFVNFLAASLMPVSFMGVMRECMSGIHRKICTFTIVAEMGFFLAEIYLHLFGILDMREMLPLISILSAGEMILNTLLFLTMKDRKRKKILVFQLLPVLIGTSADYIVYWQGLEEMWEEGYFTTIGVLLFLFIQLSAKLITQARKLSFMQQRTIEGMASLIESRDGSTGAHVRNTGVYARMIAKEMYRRGMYPEEINSEFIDMIGWMAPLHDVGKIKISDTILNKPGKFTPQEYEIMKTHTVMGGEIIGTILKDSLDPDMLDMAMNIATYHHERWDGTGYPFGKKGTEIPLCARIMAVADVFDALSSRRVYKEEMDIDQVFHEMVLNENKQFQKEIVEIVLSLRPQLEAYLAQTKKAAEQRNKVS